MQKPFNEAFSDLLVEYQTTDLEDVMAVLEKAAAALHHDREHNAGYNHAAGLTHDALAS